MRVHPLTLPRPGHVLLEPLYSPMLFLVLKIIKNLILKHTSTTGKRVLSCTGEPPMEILIVGCRIELLTILRLFPRDTCGRKNPSMVSNNERGVKRYL